MSHYIVGENRSVFRRGITHIEETNVERQIFFGFSLILLTNMLKDLDAKTKLASKDRFSH